jgi:nitrate/TMAO reductase-like tetraheme cytochrome c subunit
MRCHWTMWFWVMLTPPASAQISGIVFNESGDPLAGAIVSWPEHPGIARAVSNASGQYSIAGPGVGSHRITAAMAFDLDAARRYRIAATSVTVGPGGVATANLVLPDVPTSDNQTYQPIKAEPPAGCGDCHGEKLGQWRASMHAAAAVDPWVFDLYDGSGTPATGGNGYVYTSSHPAGSTGTCAVCHTPTANPRDAGSVMLNAVTSASGLEGVTCSACHQLAAVDGPVNALHLMGGARVFFPGVNGSATTHDYVWGPLPDSTAPAMETMYAPWIAESRFCASCHEYDNPDTGAPGQRTYSEWLASAYAQPGAGYRSCQDCHMPEAASAGTIADADRLGALARPASQIHDHQIRADATGTLAQALALSVDASAQGGVLQVDVTLTNQALGHAFPTGIAIRNALLVVRARRNGNALALQAGPVLPWWADDDVAGQQQGDLAGQPGLGFAKVLEGRIAGQGSVVRPVLFVDAESVSEDSVLAAGATRNGQFAFALGSAMVGDQVTVEAELIYRRAWRALAVTKGWSIRIDGRPWEQSILMQSRQLTLDPTALDPIFRHGFE